MTMVQSKSGTAMAGTDQSDGGASPGVLRRVWHSYMGIIRFFCPDA